MAVTRGTTVNVDWTLNESASTASLTCTLPSAMAAGKLLVAHVVASTSSPGLPGTGSWQWAAGSPLGTNNEALVGLAYTTDPAAGLAFTQATAGRMTVILTVYSGENALTVIDVTPTTNNVLTQSMTLTGITTVTDGDMLVSGCGINASTITTITQPSGWSLVARNTSGTGKGGAYADLGQATQGATGDEVWTNDATAGLRQVGYLAALRPAAATGPVASYVPYASLRGPLSAITRGQLVANSFGGLITAAAGLSAGTAPPMPFVVASNPTPQPATVLAARGSLVDVSTPGPVVVTASPTALPSLIVTSRSGLTDASVVTTSGPLVVTEPRRPPAPNTVITLRGSLADAVVTPSSTPAPIVATTPTTNQPVAVITSRSTLVDAPVPTTTGPLVVTAPTVNRPAGVVAARGSLADAVVVSTVPAAPLVVTSQIRPAAATVAVLRGSLVDPAASRPIVVTPAGLCTTIPAPTLLRGSLFDTLPAGGARTTAPLLVIQRPAVPLAPTVLLLGVGATPHSCSTPRPFTGTAARPSTGTTAYALATTARPNSGTTSRPDTGRTEDPC